MGIKKLLSGDVTFKRQESSGAVKTQLGPVPPVPKPDQRMQCSCGCDTFWVTRVDFACSQCFKSYRD